MKIVADTNIPFLKGVLEPYAEVVYLEGRAIGREQMQDADAVIIRTRTRCNEETLSGSKVKIIASATIGTDHIDLPWCKSAGIQVYNAAGCNARAVADYVFSALYGVASRHTLRLEGATLGIIGVGNVGKLVKEMGEKLGFRVLLCDPPRAAAEGPDGFVSLDTLLSESDVITIHTPLDATTRNLCDDSFFQKMKSGAVLINAARGEIIDEPSLLRFKPKIGALVLDTWCNEPFVNANVLEICDIATPHIAGYSYQGKQNGTAMTVQAVAKFFGIKELENFHPATMSDSLKPVGVDVQGKNQGEIAAVLQYNYPVFTDDFLFRSAPETFERLRAEYNYRREYFIN